MYGTCICFILLQCKFEVNIWTPCSSKAKKFGSLFSKFWPITLCLKLTSYCRPVISLDFSWFQDFVQISLCLTSFLKEKKSPPRKERSSMYCVQTSSFLFVGMWRVCKSSKMKRPRVSSRLKGDLGLLKLQYFPESGILLRTIRAYWSKRRVVPPVLFRTNYYSIEILHGVTAIILTDLM